VKAAGPIERRQPLEHADLPDPEPAAGEVVVQVEAEGICRTDRHVWNGDWAWVGLTPTPDAALEQASEVLDAMDSCETLGFSVITGF
jgi:threonine dehydrogenase-like Zn-dependent dehydrogenase